jgi:hypothetical protein
MVYDSLLIYMGKQVKDYRHDCDMNPNMMSITT